MHFVFSQDVHAPIECIREFYGDVKNLVRISPAFPVMKIEAEDTQVEAGRQFAIQLDFLLFKVKWYASIEAVVPGHYFVDTFHSPLVRRWRHVHRYEPRTTGTRLTDEIECEVSPLLVPLAWLCIRILFVFRTRAFRKAFS